MAVLAILWLLLPCLDPGVAPARRGATLSFVDDRGSLIEARLTACFQIELRNDCTTVTSGSVALPESFQIVRVEGSEHGPVSVPRGELDRDGHTTLRVPRKGEARSRVGLLASDAVALSPAGRCLPQASRTRNFEGC